MSARNASRDATPPAVPGHLNTARVLTLLCGAMIVWGSLYPFDFFWPNSAIFTRRLAHIASHYLTRGDLIANLLIYMPFGALFVMAIAGPSRATRAALAVIAGSMLALTMEVLQLFTPLRVTSIFDWALNTCGALAGATGTVLYLSIGERWRFESIFGVRPALIPLAVILLWFMTQLAPYTPVFSMVRLRDSLHPLLTPHAPSLEGLATLLASWWIVGLAAVNIWRRGAAAWAVLALMLAMWLGRLLVAGQHQSLAEIFVCCAVLAGLWIGARRPRARAVIGAAAAIAALIIGGLWPFDFARQAGAFHWIPFSGNLLLTRDYVPLLGKIFLYTALLWALTLSFRRLSPAFAVAFVLTTVVEIEQLWMPDRRAEITDPLLIILLAVAFAIARRFQPHALGLEHPLASGLPRGANNKRDPR